MWHHGVMKKSLLFFVFALSLCSFVLAGELAQLHRQLNPTTTETSGTSEGDCKPKKVGELVDLSSCLPQTNPQRIDKAETQITTIGIERTRCLTDCPAYTFIVQADGTFRYTGEYGVERLGEYTGTVEKGTLNQVLRFIDESDFMSFDSSYTTPFLDNATTYTLVTKQGEQKVIENYANAGPATLWAIEELIAGLLETAEWDEGGGEM